MIDLEATYLRMRQADALLAATNLKLSPQQVVILHAIKDGVRGAADLARRINVAPTVITGLVDRLEREGYVVRRDDKADRRRHTISITAHGMGALAAAIAALADEDRAAEAAA